MANTAFTGRQLGEAADVVRVVEGVSGRVPVQAALRLRFDYGRIVPWVYRERDALVAVAGPDAAWLRTPVRLRGENMSTRAAKMLADDMQARGPVRLKDVDAAQALLVNLAKDLAAKGEIMISKNRADEELVY